MQLKSVCVLLSQNRGSWDNTKLGEVAEYMTRTNNNMCIFVPVERVGIKSGIFRGIRENNFGLELWQF